MAFDLTAPFFWGPGGTQMTPGQIAAQRKVAEAMKQQGADYSPVRSPWQGAARVAQAMIGGYQAGQADKADQDNAALSNELMAKMLGQLPPQANGGGVSSSLSTAPVVPESTASEPKASRTPGASVTDRPEVASSSRVWGDKEAEDAGLYEKPAVKPSVATVASALPAPAPAAAAPSPAVQAVSGAMNPAAIQLATSPYVTDDARKMGMMMLAAAMKPKEYSYQTTADGTILRMDPRGGAPVPVYQAATKPSFVKVGTDPNTGQDVMGFVDATGRKVDIYKPDIGQPPESSTIPPVPPGVDPKVWRETFSKSAAANAAPGSFDDTAKMRHEFTQLPSYKNMAQAAPIYQAMYEAAGRDTKAADLNIVYGLGKIMDPTSVVREGELQMANAAQGIQERLNGLIAQINSKGALTPEGRQALMAEAYGRLTSYQQQFDQDAGRYRGITERNRINAADVIPDFGEFKPWTMPAKAGADGWIERGGVRIRQKPEAK